MYKKIIQDQIEVLETKKADIYKQDLENFLNNVMSGSGIPAEKKAKAQEWITKKNYWQAAIVLGDYINSDEAKLIGQYEENKVFVQRYINAVRNVMGKLSRILKTPTLIEFGTSGWRGKIGEDFTVLNVHKVARAIVDTLRTDEFLKTNRYKSFREVQQKGIVVFRDNRYMGEDYIQAVMKELTAAGIKIYYAGECPTGIGSALVTKLKAAGSINFTPSHNPMSDAGLKFNPADGGPADKNITDIIQSTANYYMQDKNFVPKDTTYIANVQKIDGVRRYINFLKKSKFINLPELREKLLANADMIALVVDNMHGASRGVIQKLLGPEVMKKLDIEFINSNEDYSFHGAKPEPSAKNQKPLMDILKKSDKKLRIAFALDPDADRIRFADADTDMDMNMASGPLLKAAIDKLTRQEKIAAAEDIAERKAFYNKYKGYPGLVTTVASSGFAAAIARKHKMLVNEVAVGFKNFRKYLTEGLAIMAFEESDGITYGGHTLEKDGFAGFLVLTDYVLTKQQNLTRIYQRLQEKYGYYYPGKGGADLPGITIEAWQEYRKKVMSILGGMFKENDTLDIGGQTKQIISIITVDGVKLVFDDGSWILLRPSGTEAKFRYYFETVGKGNDKLFPQYLEAASGILQKARDQVPN